MKGANSSSKMDDSGDDVYQEERANVPTSTIPPASMGRPDGRKREKEKLKREGEVEAMKKRSMS